MEECIEGKRFDLYGLLGQAVEQLPPRRGGGRLRELPPGADAPELRVAQAELGYDCTVGTIDIYQNSGGNLTRYTFRITVTHHHKTLKTEEVSSLLDQLSKVAYEMHEAKRI